MMASFKMFQHLELPKLKARAKILDDCPRTRHNLTCKRCHSVYEKILSINETDETAWQGLIQNNVLDGQEHQAKWTLKRWEKVALEFGFDPPNFQFPDSTQQQITK